jgi:signal transduction histidine kinase
MVLDIWRTAPDGSVHVRALKLPATELTSNIEPDDLAPERLSAREAAHSRPLRNPRGQPLGTLVVHTHHAPLRVQSQDALDILAEHLSILLERWRTVRTRYGIGRALEAQHLPAHGVLQSQPEATGTEEARTLRLLLRALRELAGVRSATALAQLPSRRLRVIVAQRRDRSLDSATGRQLLAALSPAAREHGVEMSQHGVDWKAIVPLLSALVPEAQPLPERLLVLPIDAVEGRLALVVLALDRSSDTSDWLHVAQALCHAAGEHIAATRASSARDAQAQALDAFLSLMVHELRGPLTSVKGYAQLLIRQARRHALPEVVMRSAAAIEQQSVRLSEMIDELHDAARIRRHRLELLTAPTDLEPIVRQQVEWWRRVAPDHTYHLLVHSEGPLVGNWDAHRVTQIVCDLLDNATRYSPNDSVIEVELAREDNAALLIVRDTGIGIPIGERRRIFDDRYRAREAQARNLSGLGLGLFVSREIAERLGGKLWLHASRTGERSGSEFRLRLPLALVAPPPPLWYTSPWATPEVP